MAMKCPTADRQQTLVGQRAMKMPEEHVMYIHITAAHLWSDHFLSITCNCVIEKRGWFKTVYDLNSYDLKQFIRNSPWHAFPHLTWVLSGKTWVSRGQNHAWEACVQLILQMFADHWTKLCFNLVLLNMIVLA